MRVPVAEQCSPITFPDGSVISHKLQKLNGKRIELQKDANGKFKQYGGGVTVPSQYLKDITTEPRYTFKYGDLVMENDLPSAYLVVFLCYNEDRTAQVWLGKGSISARNSVDLIPYEPKKHLPKLLDVE